MTADATNRLALVVTMVLNMNRHYSLKDSPMFKSGVFARSFTVLVIVVTALLPRDAECKGIFGIGDGKPGVLGIGDEKPGALGIGDGKEGALGIGDNRPGALGVGEDNDPRPLCCRARMSKRERRAHDRAHKRERARQGKLRTGVAGIGDGRPGVAGVGDEKPGVLGIGDGKPGALGIGDGKAGALGVGERKGR